MCLAVPMEIIRIKGDKARALISGLEKEVDVRLLQDLEVGDYVIVHAGFAIEKIDPAEARRTLDLFREIEKKLAASE